MLSNQLLRRYLGFRMARERYGPSSGGKAGRRAYIRLLDCSFGMARHCKDPMHRTFA